MANRVQDIQERISPENWHYCPGEENPADLVTRGTSVQQLINSQHWWHGPSWLLEDTSYCPQNRPSNELSEENLAKASTEEHSAEHVAVQDTMKYPEFAKKHESW